MTKEHSSQEREWDDLNKFLEERCFEIGTQEEMEIMKEVYPEFEGTFGIDKNKLKSFIRFVEDQARLKTMKDVLQMLPKEKGNIGMGDFKTGMLAGFNEAISEIKSTLQTHIKELEK